MLRVEGLHITYGAIEAVKGISFDIEEGAIVSLIGANGAGKTTTLNTICGLMSPKAGTIEFDGDNIVGEPPHKVVRRGIVQVPEGRKVFENLTVYECLVMGGLTRRDGKEMRRDLERMCELFPRLGERRRQLTRTLSGGEQQMLAFARALMAKPRLLLLDEPSMGLAPQIVEDVIEQILRVNSQGVTVLLVEQNAEIALEISDRSYVLETGQIALSGSGRELLSNDNVRKAYLGMT